MEVEKLQRLMNCAPCVFKWNWSLWNRWIESFSHGMTLFWPYQIKAFSTERVSLCATEVESKIQNNAIFLHFRLPSMPLFTPVFWPMHPLNMCEKNAYCITVNPLSQQFILSPHWWNWMSILKITLTWTYVSGKMTNARIIIFNPLKLWLRSGIWTGFKLGICQEKD